VGDACTLQASLEAAQCVLSNGAGHAAGGGVLGLQWTFFFSSFG